MGLAAYSFMDKQFFVKKQQNSSRSSSILSRFFWSFFPVTRQEYSKFFSIALLMFLILLNSGLMRDIRSSLIVNRIGTPVLNFIRIFIELPCGVVFVLCYTWLCGRFGSLRTFRIIVCFYFCFFSVFGYFMLPYQNFLQPDSFLVNQCIERYPHLTWFINMWREWTLVLFYVMSELWSIIIYTLLFWQLANSIVQVEQATRFYFLFNLFGQLNGVFQCVVIKRFIRVPASNMLSADQDTHLGQVQSLVGFVMLTFCAIVVIHWFIEKKFIVHQNADCNSLLSNQRENVKVGVFEGIKIVLKSSYLSCIAVAMLSYSTVMNLIEGVWFEEVKRYYNGCDGKFTLYLGNAYLFVSIGATICSFFGRFIIQKLGFRWAALMTPILALLSGGLFFLTVVLNYFGLLPATIVGVSPLACIVLLGTLQNTLIKSAKFSFFDITKEMAYMPLSDKMRTQGKAAVDVFGGKFGQSFSAIIQMLLYSKYFEVTPEQLSPLLSVLFVLTCLLWIKAGGILAKQYAALVIDQSK